MRSHTRRLAAMLVCGLTLLASPLDARAQRDSFGRQSSKRSSPRSRRSAGKTKVIVEILTGEQGAGLNTRHWRPILEELGYAMRIRRGTSRDKIEIREKKFGRLREILVVGRLGPRGKLIFDGRSFSRKDNDKLAEWLRELETYGAQGAPEGKPLWGLTQAQFDSIISSLSQTNSDNLAGLSFRAAVDKLQLPQATPARISTATNDWLRQTFKTTPPGRLNLKNISKGSAFALLLNQYGLGFRPLRTPEGNVELVVDPITKTSQVWPVGWEPKQKSHLLVPKLYEFLPLHLEEVLLTEVFETIATQTNVPVYVDHFALKVEGIDLKTLRASHPERKTTLGLLLRRVINKHRLQKKILVDEEERPFIWITTLVPGRASR